eukprot:Polyplicarium_translucidae@DN3247_c0_g1_i10.p1
MRRTPPASLERPPLSLFVANVVPFLDERDLCGGLLSTCRWADRLPREVRLRFGRGLCAERLQLGRGLGASYRANIEYLMYRMSEKLLNLRGFYALDVCAFQRQVGANSWLVSDQPLLGPPTDALRLDLRRDRSGAWLRPDAADISDLRDRLRNYVRDLTQQRTIVLPLLKSIDALRSGYFCMFCLRLVCPNLRELFIGMNGKRFVDKHMASLKRVVAERQPHPDAVRFGGVQRGFICDEVSAMLARWDCVRPTVDVPLDAADWEVHFASRQLRAKTGFFVTSRRPTRPCTAASILRSAKVTWMPGSVCESLHALEAMADELEVSDDEYYLDELYVGCCHSDGRGEHEGRRIINPPVKRARLARRIHIDGEVCRPCRRWLRDMNDAVEIAVSGRNLPPAMTMICKRSRHELFASTWSYSPRRSRADCPHRDLLPMTRMCEVAEWFVAECRCIFDWKLPRALFQSAAASPDAEERLSRHETRRIGEALEACVSRAWEWSGVEQSL